MAELLTLSTDVIDGEDVGSMKRINLHLSEIGSETTKKPLARGGKRFT